jgi:hypothetical protein
MNGPLRRIVEMRAGAITRRTRDGQSYEGQGYDEVLECGHVFVPFDNHHFGGQDEPKSIGERRRCTMCKKEKQ